MGAMSRIAHVCSRLIPAGDRESILGDLFEDAEFRGLDGVRREAWLAGQCGLIASGLSLERLRGWLVLPPVHEVVSGFAVDGRGLLRDSGAGAIWRALLFIGSVAALVVGVEVLVSTLMSAAGF